MRMILSALLAALFCATTAFAGSFKDNGNGTITDLTTNLVWQQCPAGLSGAGCAGGSVVNYLWDDAISYCESLSLGGFTDWRLPNIKELKSIVDTTTYNPAINTAYFPATQSAYYWSSTTYAAGTGYARRVSFGYGFADSYLKTLTCDVRCVRGQ